MVPARRTTTVSVTASSTVMRAVTRSALPSPLGLKRSRLTVTPTVGGVTSSPGPGLGSVVGVVVAGGASGTVVGAVVAGTVVAPGRSGPVVVGAGAVWAAAGTASSPRARRTVISTRRIGPAFPMDQVTVGVERPFLPGGDHQSSGREGRVSGAAAGGPRRCPSRPSRAR